MTTALYLPAFAQALLMVWDEGYFHRRRGLPGWERRGHPVDSAAFLLCLVWVILFSPTSENLVGYVILSTLSSLIVTKDEWVHAKVCTATEHWLHSVLFTLHPVVLGVNGYLWFAGGADTFFRVQAAAVSVMLLYQMVYWNFLRHETRAQNQ